MSARRFRVATAACLTAGAAAMAVLLAVGYRYAFPRLADRVHRRTR